MSAESESQLETIRRLKREGLSMSDIVTRLNGAPAPAPVAAAPAQSGAPLRVTIEEIQHPAYMVNHNFEVVWMNDAARRTVFAEVTAMPPTNEARSLFRLVPASRNEWSSLLRFHVAAAKEKVSAEAFAKACVGLEPVAYARLQAAYLDMDAEPINGTVGTCVNVRDAQGNDATHTAHVSSYREGMFVVLVPGDDTNDAMLELLARRDEVIRSLLRKRMPVLTQLAVLVSDLQGSVKICSELPPEEYFELINQIWTAMAPIFRKYHGTCGKHVGDGMVYYFFPQADSDYLTNALACAHEIRVAIRKLSNEWQLRKNWLNELYLNTGITEGQEWLGTYQSSTGVEFVVLGDTINQAARISDLARHGGVWATKSVIGKIPAEHQSRVSYGVRRRSADGREVFVNSSYSLVQTLIEQDGARLEKLRDISTLAVTEVVDIKPLLS